MKKLIVSLVIVLFCAGIVGASDTTSPISTFNLSVTGPTVIGGTSVFVVNTNKSYVDNKALKLNNRVYALQVYQIATSSGVYADSGATYTIRYRTGIHDGSWSSGVTTIVGPIMISGQTTEVITFSPEFANYYRIELVTGITSFTSLKADVIAQ